MRALVVVVLVGCSSATPEPVVAEDSSSPEVAPPEDTAVVEVTRNPAGDCPACEATKCRTELNACGADSACVNWLLCMNECFRKPGAAACQQKCTDGAKNPRADAMIACRKANCVEACLPLD